MAVLFISTEKDIALLPGSPVKGDAVIKASSYSVLTEEHAEGRMQEWMDESPYHQHEPGYTKPWFKWIPADECPTCPVAGPRRALAPAGKCWHYVQHKTNGRRYLLCTLNENSPIFGRSEFRSLDGQSRWDKKDLAQWLPKSGFRGCPRMTIPTDSITKIERLDTEYEADHKEPAPQQARTESFDLLDKIKAWGEREKEKINQAPLIDVINMTQAQIRTEKGIGPKKVVKPARKVAVSWRPESLETETNFPF